METAKIVFLNGTELETDHNGNCFIVDIEPQFPDDLSEVTITITSEEEIPQEPVYETITTTDTLYNVSVQECYSDDDRYWFTFIPVSSESKLEAQVFYTAMMTDTLMEE